MLTKFDWINAISLYVGVKWKNWKLLDVIYAISNVHASHHCSKLANPATFHILIFVIDVFLSCRTTANTTDTA